MPVVYGFIRGIELGTASVLFLFDRKKKIPLRKRK